MTKKEALEYIASHDDSDILDDSDVEAAYIALYEQVPDDLAREEGLWSHCCCYCPDPQPRPQGHRRMK